MRPLRALPLLALAAAVLPVAPATADDRYTRCDEVPGASLVMIARATCDEARAAALAVVAAPAADSGAAMGATGWVPLRAASAGNGEFDVVGMRGTAALRVRRRGATPDLDGFTAGRELVFARSRIVGGRPIPNGAAFCTSSFLIRLPNGSLGGLSAAHCAGETSKGLVARRNAAMRRPPSPGLVLGTVQRYVVRSAPLDALVLPVPSGSSRSSLPVVDRGITRPPWVVAGTARLLSGREVCYTGRTSGPDRCGVIRGARRAERILALQSGLVVRCTSVRAASGDSGGPVYTAPRSDGTVRALGIVTLVVGRSAAMCFTPLEPVLDRLRARLVAGR
jgi:hypothetical protein